jgi:hypothetical protein
VISAAGGEDALSGLAELALALRVPLLVVVPLALFYVGVSLRGKAFLGPIAAAVVGVAGLGILALTLPVAWLLAVGLAPPILGWGMARLGGRPPSREPN